MKKLLCMLVIAFTAITSNAQFTKAKLQATGLTCAMCSNAINKALQKVPFVESVRSDIKNSAFSITFKSGQDVVVDALKEAVEDAGFSIGHLELTTAFNALTVQKDQHIKIGNEHFHFLNAAGETLNGEHVVTVVDKKYVTERQFRKYSASTKMDCMETGKAAACCTKDGIAAGQRVYHIII